MTGTWLEAIGYCGTLATFVSYSMRTIVPLRLASILSSVFFITYAGLSGLWPVLATELILLPLNLVRLTQDLKRPIVEGSA
jgi:CRP/FNR family cyclic AMP-dependent transcriptional regulator